MLWERATCVSCHPPPMEGLAAKYARFLGEMPWHSSAFIFLSSLSFLRKLRGVSLLFDKLSLYLDVLPSAWIGQAYLSDSLPPCSLFKDSLL